LRFHRAAVCAIEAADREIVSRWVSLDIGMSHWLLALGAWLVDVKNQRHGEHLPR
jgi:hypothetical protein